MNAGGYVVNDYKTEKTLIENNTDSGMTVNARTGEITYGENYQPNRDVSYTVAFSCTDCDPEDFDGDGTDDWYGAWSTSETEFTLIGFSQGDLLCASVTGISSALGVTLPSDQSCAEVPGAAPACGAGDTNQDGTVNVSDIVLVVNYILAGNSVAEGCYDVNTDGVVNVSDIVNIVNYILGGGSLGSAATEAVIETASNELSVRGVNGTVDGVQLTLSHGADFSIDLVETSGIEVAAQNSIDENTTIVLVAKQNLKHIGTTTGDYTIVDHLVVATDRVGQVVEVSTTTATEIVDFKLGKAYPNPFNPTTNLELAIPEAGYVSVKVYNLVGQEVATLVDGMMDANPIIHSSGMQVHYQVVFTW